MHIKFSFSIEFLVVVESATPLRLRSSTARRKIYVRSRETPYFEIRYAIENSLSVYDIYVVYAGIFHVAIIISRT